MTRESASGASRRGASVDTLQMLKREHVLNRVVDATLAAIAALAVAAIAAGWFVRVSVGPGTTRIVQRERLLYAVVRQIRAHGVSP